MMAAPLSFGGPERYIQGLTYLANPARIISAVMVEKNLRDICKDGRVSVNLSAAEQPAPPPLSEKLLAIGRRLFGARVASVTSPNSPKELDGFESRVISTLIHLFHKYPVSCLQKLDSPTLLKLIEADNKREGRTVAETAERRSDLLNKLPESIQYAFHDNLYRPHDYSPLITTIHSRGATMDPFGRTVPTSAYAPGGPDKPGQTLSWFPNIADDQQPMWRNLGFETLNNVAAAHAGGRVTVTITTTTGAESYTMDIQGNIIGAVPVPNPFDGNTVKNKWLRITDISTGANQATADKLVLYKEACGDTLQVVDAKIFLGDDGHRGCMFTSDNVVLLMALCAGVSVCAGILKEPNDPTRQLHQGMLYMPKKDVDEMALKREFITMCHNYNVKQVKVIESSIGRYVSVDGDSDATISEALQEAFGKVLEFAGRIFDFLGEHIGRDIPSFKKLCTSCYIVNIVNSTSRGYKVNQYKKLLKKNTAFPEIATALDAHDPVYAVKIRSVKTSKSRRTRRRRAQTGGGAEKPPGESGFLSSTARFYDVASYFGFTDNDSKYNALCDYYPYYEYVGECGCHATMITHLRDKLATDLDYDLNAFEAWYLDTLALQQANSRDSEEEDAVEKDKADSYLGKNGGKDSKGGGDKPSGDEDDEGGDPRGGGGAPSSFWSSMLSQSMRAVSPSGQSSSSSQSIPSTVKGSLQFSEGTSQPNSEIASESVSTFGSPRSQRHPWSTSAIQVVSSDVTSVRLQPLFGSPSLNEYKPVSQIAHPGIFVQDLWKGGGSSSSAAGGGGSAPSAAGGGGSAPSAAGGGGSSSSAAGGGGSPPSAAGGGGSSSSAAGGGVSAAPQSATLKRKSSQEIRNQLSPNAQRPRSVTSTPIPTPTPTQPLDIDEDAAEGAEEGAEGAKEGAEGGGGSMRRRTSRKYPRKTRKARKSTKRRSRSRR